MYVFACLFVVCVCVFGRLFGCLVVLSVSFARLVGRLVLSDSVRVRFFVCLIVCLCVCV